MRGFTERMSLPSAEWKSRNPVLQYPMLPRMVDCGPDGLHAEEIPIRSLDTARCARGSWNFPMAVGEIQRNEIDLKE
jgi:hypothetical protein